MVVLLLLLGAAWAACAYADAHRVRDMTHQMEKAEAYALVIALSAQRDSILADYRQAVEDIKQMRDLQIQVNAREMQRRLMSLRYCGLN